MRAIAVVAALLLLLAGLLPATADAGERVTVTVKLGSAGAGTKVEILDPQGNSLGSGVADAKGEFKAEVELPDGVDRVVVATNGAAADSRGAFTVGGPGSDYSISVYQGKASDGPAILARIRQAVAKCDKAEYDRSVAELDRRIAELEQDVDQKQAAADKFARDNNLRITNLKGARKDLDRAAKAQQKIQDPALRNTAMLQALDLYVKLLEDLELAKQEWEAARKAREAVPPFPKDCKKKDEVGMAPGKCPDGSGGLLAGAINDIFGTDLDPACADPSQRRDTDRPKKDRERDREHRD